MKIENYNDLKFTSLKHGVGIIHFKYKQENYTLINGGTEMTLVTYLYKGRMKCNLKYISSCYGADFCIIRYNNNKKVLSAIDKEHFVLSLVKRKILEGTKEQLIKIKEIEKNSLKDELNIIAQKINEINKEILNIEKEE